jgi:hypothetical protein
MSKTNDGLVFLGAVFGIFIAIIIDVTINWNHREGEIRSAEYFEVGEDIYFCNQVEPRLKTLKRLKKEKLENEAKLDDSIGKDVIFAPQLKFESNTAPLIIGE